MSDNRYQGSVHISEIGDDLHQLGLCRELAPQSSSHASSTLEIVSTDWRPVVELTFAKDRGKDRRPNQTIDVEQFIDIKGISAQGNQLSRLKVNEID